MKLKKHNVEQMACVYLMYELTRRGYRVQITNSGFIMGSTTTMKLWRNYKNKAIKSGAQEDTIWGLNWKQPHAFENRYEILPE